MSPTSIDRSVTEHVDTLRANLWGADETLYAIERLIEKQWTPVGTPPARTRACLLRVLTQLRDNVDLRIKEIKNA